MTHHGVHSPTDGSLALSPVPCIVFSIDHRGILTRATGSGLAAGGYDSASIVGRTTDEVCEGWPEPVACIRRALQGEEVTAVIEWAGRRWSAWYLPQRSPSGAVVGVDGFVVEVGEEPHAPDLYEIDAGVLPPLLRAGVVRLFRPQPKRRATRPSYLRLLPD